MKAKGGERKLPLQNGHTRSAAKATESSVLPGRATNGNGNGARGQTYRYILLVRLRRQLADPQGETIRKSLISLGWDTVEDVRVGKQVELEIIAGDSLAAEQAVAAMAERLLVNDVIEEFKVLPVQSDAL